MVLENSKMDLKRQRLKYMLSNAILELWKKETGSLSSVIIEGTICITSGNGKTTVVQVADKFYGTLPGADTLNNNYGSADGYPANCNGTGPWSVVSPTGTGTIRDDSGYHETESDTSGTINFTKQDNPKVVIENETLESPQSAKKAKVSDDTTLDTSDSSITHNDSSPVSEKGQKDPKYIERDENFNTPMGYGVGSFCPGTGYYTCSKDFNDERNKEVLENIKNESDKKLTVKSEYDDGERNEGENEEKPYGTIESEGELTIDTGARDDRSQDEDEGDSEREAMDLSRKDGDLSVMSPQNYTAQVRSVIRQRLLNAGKTSPDGDPEKAEDERETPQPLKSLGLHRSQNSESDGDSETSPSDNKKPWPLIAMNNVVQQVGHSLPTKPVMNGTGIPPFPMLSPIPISAMASLYHTPPSHMHNVLKRKAPPMPPALIPFAHPMMQMGLVPPPTSPLLTPPLPLRSPTGLSSKETSPVSPTGSKDSDKDSTSPDQRIYQCDFCNKTFLFKSKYHEHLPVHTNARPFQCHLCSRTYKYKYDLRVHLRTHMGIPTKSTVCPFCATKFDTNKQLRMHIKDSHREQQKVSEEECTDPKDNLPPAL